MGGRVRWGKDDGGTGMARPSGPAGAGVRHRQQRLRLPACAVWSEPGIAFDEKDPKRI